MNISRESVYSVYTVESQQLKCLHNSLHFFQSVYIVDNQQSKCLHFVRQEVGLEIEISLAPATG
jgi:hypothetical protein